MAFQELLDGLKGSYPQGTSERFRLLDAYERMLDGRIFDHLPHPFSDEYSAGTYIPLRERRPSAPFNLATIIVDQTAGLLFGDEQSPNIRVWDDGESHKEIEEAIQSLIEECELDAVMMEAVEFGSVGSCAIVVRADDEKKPDFEVVRGKFARPVFSADNRNRLDAIVQIYPTKGKHLLELGYELKEENPEEKDYWMRIVIDNASEVRYKPLTDEKYQRLGQNDEFGVPIRWERDDERSFDHKFGIVPAVWIRNLVRSAGIDGPCTFGKIVDDIVEIAYIRSQLGRGIKYTADPLLAVKRGELASSITGPLGELTIKDNDGRLVRTASNVLDLEAGGDAKLLEITGKGFDAANAHIDKMREWALEVVGGMKSSAEHQKGVQSGRALDILNEALRLLVKRQRIAYGTRGLLPLIKITLHGIARGLLAVDGVDAIAPDTRLRLVWPKPVMAGQDLQAHATGLQLLAGGSATAPVPLLARNTVSQQAASSVGITDANEAVNELEQQVKADKVQADKDAQDDMNRQVQLHKATKGSDK